MFARVNEKQAILPGFYLTAKFRCFTDSELSFTARRHIDEHYFVGHSCALNS